jgi:hypothetical protein
MDSNAVDPLADMPGAYEVDREAVEAGHLEILFTHVTIDELAAIGDLDRRRLLLLLLIDLGRLVPSGAFILGRSRLDFGRLRDDTESETGSHLIARTANGPAMDRERPRSGRPGPMAARLDEIAAGQRLRGVYAASGHILCRCASSGVSARRSGVPGGVRAGGEFQ